MADVMARDPYSARMMAVMPVTMADHDDDCGIGGRGEGACDGDGDEEREDDFLHDHGEIDRGLYYAGRTSGMR